MSINYAGATSGKRILAIGRPVSFDILVIGVAWGAKLAPGFSNK